MNLFFDVDYTLIDHRGSLRPLVHEVFGDLKTNGHDIYIWSGMGLRNKEVEENNLTDFVSGIYHKPVEKFEEGLIQYGIPVRPEYVVDDHHGTLSRSRHTLPDDAWDGWASRCAVVSSIGIRGDCAFVAQGADS